MEVPDMSFVRLSKCALILVTGSILIQAISAASQTKPYVAQQVTENDIPVIRLVDSVRGVEVSVVPSLGNRAYEMKMHGKNILHFPYADLAEFQKKPGLNSIPFLAPWANRIDGTGFYANGKKYEFNLGLGNVSKTGLPMHGLLSASGLWKVTEVAADARSAHVTSKLEFWRNPALMAQWPFAHEYEMTYRLADGMLEVNVVITNLSSEAMPVAVGFHPYFRIPDIPRDEWTLRMPACKAVVADERRIPTGEFKPCDLPNPLPLQGRTLDNGFTDLERGADGRARFAIESAGKTVEVFFGPKYLVAVIWEPAAPAGQTREFVCIEPMASVTNGINMGHAGTYPDLQTIPAGGKWSESFWIRAAGF
jgi:aldose 1-epimerase